METPIAACENFCAMQTIGELALELAELYSSDVSTPVSKEV
jgi:hypothetical protein